MPNYSRIIAGTRPLRKPEPVDHVKALIDLIQGSTGKVVVVVGPRNSGITQLIRGQVLPRLAPQESTAFFDCATRISEEVLEAVSRPNMTVVLDSFDRFLRLPESIQKPGLEAVLSNRRRATVVLVADKQSLADFSELRASAPDILKNLFELPDLRLNVELERYRPPSGAALTWEPAVLRALEDDLARFADATVTPRLIEIIDDGFRSGAYDRDQGLSGLLERDLKRTLMRLDEEPEFGQDAEDIALAILKEMSAQGQIEGIFLEEVAARLDVPVDMVSRCRRWLVETSGLIKRSAAEELIFQPPQLAFVLEKQMARDRESCAIAERLLADGIESRNKVGALLPRERFREIDALRILLRTTSEQASFLLQCALRSDPDRDPGSVDYWLRRVGDPALEINALGSALIADPTFRARRRAASLLARLDEPRSQGYLCRAALEDASEDVRREAVKSLSAFANKAPIREVLTRAALKGDGEARIRAIQALHIFSDEDCAHLLEGIVNDRQVEDEERGAAISALARARSEAGLSALVRIALHDADKEDRDRAAAALAGLDSEDLTESGLNAVFLDWHATRPAKGRAWWKKLGHWAAALVVAILSLPIQGLPLLIFGRWLAGGAFLAVEAACLTAVVSGLADGWILLILFLNWCASVAAGAWVARRRRARPGSFRQALSKAFLINAMLSGGLLVHGLGHWIAGRKRQAWQIMSLEAVALLALLTTLPHWDIFYVGIARDFYERLTIGLFYLFRFGGVALSWTWAVISLTLEERSGRARPWLAETYSRILRALLKNPGSAGVLRRHLAGEPLKSQAARQMVRHLGDSIPGSDLLSVVERDVRDEKRTPKEILMCLARHKEKKGYETVVSEAGEQLDRLPIRQRDPLVDILARCPSEASVRCLFERRAALRPWNRVRLLIAMIVRPFRGWNVAVRLATLAAAFLAVLLIVDGIRTNSNPGWPQIKELRRLSGTWRPDRSQDVATVAQFLAVRYPISSAQELVDVFRELIEDGASAAGLAASLGWLATSHRAESVTSLEAESRARATAVSALIKAMKDDLKRRQTMGAAKVAIQDAAMRGGSAELVAGLASLLDQPSSAEAPSVPAEQSPNTQLLQGDVAAMLTGLAGPSATDRAEARRTIAEHAGSLEALLRTSATREVKKAALSALEASNSDEAVKAIKAFILSKAIPTTEARLPGTPAVDPTGARQTDDLVRIQRESQIAAVDSLRAIRRPAAQAALEEIEKEVGLPAEVVAKLKAPFGREAAVGLDNEARALLLEDRRDEALKKARDAVAADENYADARGTLGSVLYQIRDFDESLREFRRATEIVPGYSWAYYMQAVILNDRNDLTGAKGVLKKAIEIEPNYPWFYSLLVQMHRERGIEGEAVDILSQYVRQYPNVGEIYLQLAYLYHEYVCRGDFTAFQKAYDTLREAMVILKDGDPEQCLLAELNLAESELTTGRYKDLVARVPALMDRVGANPDRIVTLDTLKLSAQVLEESDENDQAALETLSHLEAIYKTEFVPRGKWHSWTYDGTILYMEKTLQDSDKSKALLTLLRAVDGISSDHATDSQPPIIGQELFDALRQALSSKGGDR